MTNPKTYRLSEATKNTISSIAIGIGLKRSDQSTVIEMTFKALQDGNIEQIKSFINSLKK
jgi:hypothetical protein